MSTNPVRAALLRRQPTIGTWIQIPHPSVAELLAQAGFDWIAVDGEHSGIVAPQMADLFRGMYGRGSVPLVRVRENDTLAIRECLDLGAQGVIVPLVNNAAEARRAVAAAKYPPAGVRGFCFSRMNNYGVDFAAYAAAANEQTAVVVMIESREAVEQVDAILAVEGVDGVFIGPYDLSGSYGIPGQTTAPPLMAARQRVLAACAAAGKSAGLHVVDPRPEALQEAVAEGFTFIAVSADIILLSQAARSCLATVRQATQRP
jgi:2-keto-3-deoxy-L-rhamnonate aldolase RhmA